jgi:hypothetical protein
VFRNTSDNSWLARLVLVILLWPGPVPVAHSHSDVADTLVGTSQLTRHLTWHHGGVSEAPEIPGGVHIHWVLRSEFFAGINAEEVLLKADCDNLTLSYVEVESTDRVVALDQVTSATFQVRQFTQCQSIDSFQLVGLLHCRQSLPELLGVMRC